MFKADVDIAFAVGAEVIEGYGSECVLRVGYCHGKRHAVKQYLLCLIPIECCAFGAYGHENIHALTVVRDGSAADDYAGSTPVAACLRVIIAAAGCKAQAHEKGHKQGRKSFKRNHAAPHSVSHRSRRM